MGKFYLYEEWRWVVRTTTDDIERIREVAKWKAELIKDTIKQLYAILDIDQIVDNAIKNKTSITITKQRIRNVLNSYSN